MKIYVRREEKGARKLRITQKIRKKMEERRKWQNIYILEYRRLKNKLGREADSAKKIFGLHL